MSTRDVYILSRVMAMSLLQRCAGAINYAEFVAATVSLSTLQQQENLRLAFDQLDCDSSGFITVDNLQAALACCKP